MAQIYRHTFILVIITCIFFYIYGFLNIGIEVEPNACHMTYMFGQPKFSRIHLASNKTHSNYGLYYYYEGYKQRDIKSFELNGAPVIFVPGSSGSYKQVRSLASVALRKSQHNRLNYFTIDFNEELSGLFGGYLSTQQDFLKSCIKTVLRFYKQHSKVVLIGHSMGGKLAQSLLTDAKIANSINTIISISAPLDEPVLNLDRLLNDFYVQIDEKMKYIRSSYMPNSETNTCVYYRLFKQAQQNYKKPAIFDNILIISTGGGNRDLIVPSALTRSKYADVHAMTSSIPGVGISCDHLSSVWCLEFMIVINRFLFSITSLHDSHVLFNDDKQKKLQSAFHYFVQPRIHNRKHKLRIEGGISVENNKLVFNKHYKSLKEQYNQFIGVARHNKFKKAFIEIIHPEGRNWLYGCILRNASDSTVNCESVISLNNYMKYMPHQDPEEHGHALIDLHNLRKMYANYTHLLVRLPISYTSTGFNVDIYDPADRIFDISTPPWYTRKPKIIVNETLSDTVYYRMQFTSLTESFQTIQLNIEPIACKHEHISISTSLCVPWAAGYDRSTSFNKSTIKQGVYINVPFNMPIGYNGSKNPVILDLHLDPSCRYELSYQYALTNSLSRLVLQYTSWLPAHLVAILFIILKNQLGRFEKKDYIKSLKPCTGFFQYTSIYVVTGCRLLHKILLYLPFPMPLLQNYSIYISLIVHSVAIALLISASLVIWSLLLVFGNIACELAKRLTRHPLPALDPLIWFVTHLPKYFGFICIGISLLTCSGFGLLMGSIFYTLILIESYREQLEIFLWKNAADIIISTLASAREAAKTDKSLFKNENDHADGPDKPDSEDKHTNDEAIENDEDNNIELCYGLENFSYHLTLLILLIILTIINGPATLAWFRAQRIGNSTYIDPIITPTMLIFGALGAIFQMEAPNSVHGITFLSTTLFLCSGLCLLYCQTAIYQINYIVAAAMTLIALQEIVGYALSISDMILN